MAPLSKWEKRLDFVRRVERGRRFEEPHGPCERHPDWQPDTTGRAPMPAHMCSFCEIEAMVNRETERETVEVEHPLNAAAPKLRDRWEEFKLEHPERFPSPLPGSDAEADALERIADARAAEAEREAAKRNRGRRGAILCGQRYSGGVLRELYAVPGRGGTRIVELS